MAIAMMATDARPPTLRSLSAYRADNEFNRPSTCSLVFVSCLRRVSSMSLNLDLGAQLPPLTPEGIALFAQRRASVVGSSVIPDWVSDSVSDREPTGVNNTRCR